MQHLAERIAEQFGNVVKRQSASALQHVDAFHREERVAGFAGQNALVCAHLRQLAFELHPELCQLEAEAVVERLYELALGGLLRSCCSN